MRDNSTTCEFSRHSRRGPQTFPNGLVSHLDQQLTQFEPTVTETCNMYITQLRQLTSYQSHLLQYQQAIINNQQATIDKFVTSKTQTEQLMSPTAIANLDIPTSNRSPKVFSPSTTTSISNTHAPGTPPRLVNSATHVESSANQDPTIIPAYPHTEDGIVSAQLALSPSNRAISKFSPRLKSNCKPETCAGPQRHNRCCEQASKSTKKRPVEKRKWKVHDYETIKDYTKPNASTSYRCNCKQKSPSLINANRDIY